MDVKPNPWSVGHDMPHFPKKTFHTLYKQMMEEEKEKEKGIK